MKSLKLKCAVLAVVATASAAAFAVDPDPTKPSNDPNDPTAPYHRYGPAMTSTAETPHVAEWQHENAQTLASAVTDETLAKFVSSEEAAVELLSKIGAAYETDPVVATQIAAVSQWTMADDDVAWWEFWAATPRADGRRVWVQALLKTAETASDSYARVVCLDQLRWCGCGCPDVIARVRALGEKTTDKAVRDQADLILKAVGAPGVHACDYPVSVEEKFVDLFNGRDLTGWTGDTAAFGVETIQMMMRGTKVTNDVNVLSYFPERKRAGSGGDLRTVKEYRNYVLRFEYCLSTNGTGGLGLRMKPGASAAYDGMCELALRDDGGSESYDKTAKKDLLPGWQYAGSAVGIAPSLRDNVGKQIWGKDVFYAGAGSYARRPGMWNFGEVKVAGSEVEVYLNGYLVMKTDVSMFRGDGDTPDGRSHPGLHRERGPIGWLGYGHRVMFKNIRIMELADEATMADANPCMKMPAPAGFETYFDGSPRQIVTMWKGVTTTEKFDNPYVRQAATPGKRAEMQKIADMGRDKHWHVRNGNLFFDGYAGGYSLATKRDYGDFEMWLDWRTMSITGDSGLYLRGGPQVQIWDAYNEWGYGSGGLFNNMTDKTGNPRHAFKIADRRVGDWNRFHIKMVGEKVTVWLNGELVVANVTLENFWDRTKAVLRSEQIELQCHGDPTEWRNIFVREL